MSTVYRNSLIYGGRAPAYRTGPNYVRSYGPLVCDLAARIGYPPDHEQEMALDALFGLREDGTNKSSAFEFALIAPRQNLKTGLLKMAALGWLYVTEQEYVMWSAHLFDTAREAFRDLSALIQDAPMLSKHLAPGVSNGVSTARGAEGIELRSRQRIAFRARTETRGRGLTGHKVVLDEAFAVTDEILGALLPTLTSVPDPQVVYASSAGMADSYQLRDVRNRGRAGVSNRLAYLEWCAPVRPCRDPECPHGKPGTETWREGCELDVVDNWRAANPLLERTRPNGSGFPLEQMHNFRAALPPLQFAREFLGRWDDPGADLVFGVGHWDKCAIPVLELGELPPVQAYGVAVSVDLKFSAIVAATTLSTPDGAEPRVLAKPLAYGPGTAWTIDTLADIADDETPVIVDSGGPAAFLMPALGKKHHVVPIVLKQYADACADLFTKVTTNTFAHGNWQELNNAVAAADWRTAGDRKVWGRRGLAGDICTLEGATLALWGAENAQPNVSTSDGDVPIV